MKVTAIIAEYDPFHNGHLYQLTEAKRLTGADFIVTVLGGNFTQRGEPAFLDRSVRAKMALSCGADLVVELPVCYACGSAEFFAGGAIYLLNAMGCVDFLCFGSECGDLLALKTAAAILAKEPPLFKEVLSASLKKGEPFPKAREAAVCAVLLQNERGRSETPSFFAMENGSCADAKSPDGRATRIRTRLHEILAQPNNILAIEYCKALQASKSAIRPVCVHRMGSGYHDLAPDGKFCSASSIRAALLSAARSGVFLQKDTLSPPAGVPGSFAPEPVPGAFLTSAVTNFLPKASADILSQEYGRSCPICPDDFSAMLAYRLLTAKDSLEFSACFDVPDAIARRIFSMRERFTGFDAFIPLVKTKNFTKTAVRRALFHILLDLPAQPEDAQKFSSYYFRVLGFRKSAAPLLRAIKEKGRLPLLTKPADARAILSSCGHFSPETKQAAFDLLETETRASRIYAAAVNSKFHCEAVNEYASPVIFP